MTDFQPERRSVGRRQADHEFELRVHTLESEMALLRESVEKNAVTAGKVLEIVTMAEGFFKTLGYLGVGVKWVGGIIAAFGAAWVAWHAGPGGK